MRAAPSVANCQAMIWPRSPKGRGLTTDRGAVRQAGQLGNLQRRPIGAQSAKRLALDDGARRLLDCAAEGGEIALDDRCIPKHSRPTQDSSTALHRTGDHELTACDCYITLDRTASFERCGAAQDGKISAKHLARTQHEVLAEHELVPAILGVNC